MSDKIGNKDEAIKQYQLQVWKSLSEILEAIKPVVISAVADHVARERARRDYGRNT